MVFHSVSEAADLIGCRPQDIANAFYRRKLDDRRVVRVAGRRIIPKDYLPEIARVMSERKTRKADK